MIRRKVRRVPLSDWVRLSIHILTFATALLAYLK